MIGTCGWVRKLTLSTRSDYDVDLGPSAANINIKMLEPKIKKVESCDMA
jgi:hypothetical protein